MYHCSATRAGVTSSESSESESLKTRWRASPARHAGCALHGIDNNPVYIRHGGTLRLKTAEFRFHTWDNSNRLLLGTIEFQKGSPYSIFMFKASNLPKNSVCVFFFFPKCSIFTSYTTEGIIQKDTSLKFFTKEFII